MKAHGWARETDAEQTFRERHWLSDDGPFWFSRASEAGSLTKRNAGCVFSWLFNSRRQALILLASNGLRLCGLTFELSCPRRQAL
jgi:hypothetical protein